jgi:excisionase family DNA binding protein
MNSKELDKKLDNILSKLKELELDETLPFKKACQYLNISSSYLYKLTYQGKIPHYKPSGKKIYFSKRELDNWIKTNFNKGGSYE